MWNWCQFSDVFVPALLYSLVITSLFLLFSYSTCVWLSWLLRVRRDEFFNCQRCWSWAELWMPNVCVSPWQKNSTTLIGQSFRKWANNNAMLTLVIVIATVLVKFYHSALTTLYSHSEIIIEIYTSKAIWSCIARLVLLWWVRSSITLYWPPSILVRDETEDLNLWFGRFWAYVHTTKL